MLTSFVSYRFMIRCCVLMIVAASLLLFGSSTFVRAQDTSTSQASNEESVPEKDDVDEEDVSVDAMDSIIKVNGEPLSPEQLRILIIVLSSIFLVATLLAILSIASMWAVFTKAGKPGWAAIIPVYQVIVLLEIAGKPTWWILFLLIPVVNVGVTLIVLIELAKTFGKGPLFGVGLFLLSFIFFPILGFGNSKYIGPQTT